MKAIILALLIVAAFAVQNKPLNNADRQKIDTLRKSGTWGGIMLGLAELHLMAQGPVDALVTAIEEVVADLEHKREHADEAFQTRTDEHNTEVRRLNDLVNEANRQIADTQDLLANVLYPQKAQLEESIADRERFVADTQQYMVDQTTQRALSNAAFLVRNQETSEGLAAVAECLEILSQLGSGAPSLMQVKRVKKSMEKVSEKLAKSKSVEKHFVQALIALATSEFADSAALQRVVEKLNEVNNNMLEALLNDSNNEEAEVATYQADMTERAKAVAEAQEQLANLNQQLVETEEAIVSAEDFVLARQYDLAGFLAELDAENASYTEATNVYNDLCAQFDKEHNACASALDLLRNSSFAGYIGDRMQMDRVIDNQHGSGVATGAGTFNFAANRLGF